jgi:ligand-binding SRPBCC domain-containing protein
MSVHELHRAQVVNRSLDEVFDFFSRASNLERLTPSLMHFELLTPEPIEMRAGVLLEYRLRVHGVPMHWISRIDEWEVGSRFVDRQIKGPYKLWVHRHEFEAIPAGTLVRHQVSYELPFGLLGELGGLPLVRSDLTRIFDYRQKVIATLFE